MTPPIFLERSRGVLAVRGRDPVRMIHGLASADIRAATATQGVYTTFLTPRGKMVADARVFARTGPGGEAWLLLDVAPDALEPLQEHLRRYVPPLFARAEDVSEAWAVVGVYGGGASEVAATVAAGCEPGSPEERVVSLDGDEDGFAVHTLLTGDDGWDVFVPAGRAGSVGDAMVAAGARPGAPETLEALRVAAGRPRWGRELTAEVIPLEAGLLERAISQTKGCYTGQEVIVRILHRGHVNRELRRLEFAEGAPPVGTELFDPETGRSRGVVTSAVENPAGALGLGYVRREVEPPAQLRAGSPEGAPVNVHALD